MTIFKTIRILFAALYWNFYQLKRNDLSSTGTQIERQLNRRKRVLRQKTLRQKLPRVQRKIVAKGWSSNAKSHRYSNQRSLRRMYRNS